MRLRAPIAARADGTYVLRLDARERELVRHLVGELRELVRDEDPAAARLFPPGSRDDEEAAAAFAELVHPELRQRRLDAADEVLRTLDAATLSQEETEAWCGSLNDLRLVLGERLGVTDDLELGALDLIRHPRGQELALYGWLTYLQSAAVEALASRL